MGSIQSLVFLLPLVFSSMAFAHGKPAPTSPTRVTIAQGELIGLQTPTIREFLGIPYATPPVGDLRFRAPRPADGWTSPRVAQTAASVCLQPKSQLSFSVHPGESLKGSEDCLYLNVYAPLDTRSPLPVMVWIHGGGYVTGAGSDYDASVLAAKQNIVVVTLNYRLAAFGFLAHTALTAEGNPLGGSGNFGTLDQQLALKWVQTNISAFGGDASDTTIFGESAGGYSVCEQMVAPASHGLFSKAIIESGLCGAYGTTTTITEADAAGDAFAKSVGCSDSANVLSCLRALPAETLATASSTRVGILGAGSWGPVYGDAVLPLDVPTALRIGNFAHVPTLNGTNHDEGRLFAWAMAASGQSLTADQFKAMVLNTYGAKAPKILAQYPPEKFTSPLMAFATLMTDAQFSCPALALDQGLAVSVPTYSYEFSDPHPNSLLPSLPAFPDSGAFHASELVYIFQSRGGLADPAKFTADQQALADRMQTAWAQFARTGDPNDGKAANWPKFLLPAAVTQQFIPGAEGPVADFAGEHACGFWSSL